MPSQRGIGFVLLFMGTLALLCLAPSSSDGQVILPDPNIAPSDQSTLNHGVIVIPDEPLPKEVEQGFERPMKSPETSSDSTDQLLLKIPDQQDAENARESDISSSVSF